MDKLPYIFYRGKKYQVEFYLDVEGNIKVLEYLDSLPMLVKVKLAALVKLMGDEGRIYDDKKYRIVNKKEKIYEFKPLKYRFFNFFYEGGKIIVTNGYRKKSQKVDKKELRKAIKMRSLYIKRERKGEYYGK